MSTRVPEAITGASGGACHKYEDDGFSNTIGMLVLSMARIN